MQDTIKYCMVVDVLQVLECKVYSCDSQLEASVGVKDKPTFPMYCATRLPTGKLTLTQVPVLKLKTKCI